MKGKVLIVVFLFLVVFGYAKNNENKKIDTTHIRAAYKKIRYGSDMLARYTMAKDLFHEFSTYSDHEILENKLVHAYHYSADIIFSHAYYNRKNEELFDYYDYIFDNNLNLMKGAAKFYMAEFYYRDGCYYESIKCYYEAIDEYVKNNLDGYIVRCYVYLSDVYNNIGSERLSQEVDSILMHTYYPKKTVSPLSKGRIIVKHASYQSMLGNYNKAIQILKSIDPSIVFREDYYFANIHNNELAKGYIKMGIVDSALVYINKTHIHTLDNSTDSQVNKYIDIALVHYNAGDFIKSFNFIEKAGNSPSFNFIGKPYLISFYRLKYLLYKQFDKPTKSLSYYEAYVKEKDALKDLNLNVFAAAYAYKLKYKKEVNQLVAEANLKDQLYQEKKRFYIFYTILFCATIFSFSAFLVYREHKKEKEKLMLAHANAKEVFEIKNKFIENLSHELSTPITILLGYLRLVNIHIIDHDIALKHLESAKRNAVYIGNSFTDFLMTLKLEKKALISVPEERKMGAFLLESVSAFGTIATLKKIQLYYVSNIGIKQKLSYDYDSLLKIINNLVSNAIKYSKPDSSVYIKSHIQESSLVLTVKDEGFGIADADQPKIFERFFQSNNRNSNGGFGIGLSLVKELVMALNGRIKLDSKLGIGSVFEVKIPLDIDSETLYINEIGSEYKRLNHFSDTSENDHNLPTILVVDDSIEMAQYIKEVLANKVNCFSAFNGREALEKLKQIDFDLILSDLSMPEMDGFSLKKEINTISAKSDIPFVIMTSSIKEYLKYNTEAPTGVNDYLFKPFSETDLIVCINSLTEKNSHIKQLQQPESETIYSGSHSKFIQKLGKIISENIDDTEFSVKELAQQCGYSNKQFTKIVKEITGLSPVKLILEFRLLKSYDLIMDKSYGTMKEVMFAVGLSSRTYFSKAFENRFGMKPADLSKKINKNNPDVL